MSGGSGDSEFRAAVADFRGALARLDAELAGADPEAGADPVHPGRAGRLDDNCKALLAVLRKRCPGLLPELDVPAGTPAEAVPIPADTASSLIVIALREQVATAATGRVPTRDGELPEVVLWQEGADALLVDIGRTQVQLTDGEIAITIPVRCDQLPDYVGQVLIRFVVGTADRPAGLFAATATHPEGPAVVVQRWGDALTALAWQAVIDVLHGVATNAGRDADGAGLVPVAIVAARTGLVVLPQARHGIDRVARA